MSYRIGFVIIVALASVTLALDYPVIDLQVANEIPDYLVQYPNASVTRIISGISPYRGYIQFVYGINTFSDIWFVNDRNTLEFPSTQDVTLEFKYPSLRNSVVISKIYIHITDDSNPANAYITSVGTGNSSIAIWVQCKATKKFQYHIEIYGRKKVTEYPSTQIKIDTKIDNYEFLYPWHHFTRMTGTQNDDHTTRYHIGSRSDADDLVSTAAAGYTFPFVQDVNLSLEYPQMEGTGANITYVEVLLTTSERANNNVYVILGGIQKNHIKLLIEARNSNSFNYSANIYGYFLE